MLILLMSAKGLHISIHFVCKAGFKLEFSYVIVHSQITYVHINLILFYHHIVSAIYINFVNLLVIMLYVILRRIHENFTQLLFCNFYLTCWYFNPIVYISLELIVQQLAGLLFQLIADQIYLSLKFCFLIFYCIL